MVSDKVYISFNAEMRLSADFLWCRDLAKLRSPPAQGSGKAQISSGQGSGKAQISSGAGVWQSSDLPRSLDMAKLRSPLERRHLAKLRSPPEHGSGC